MQKYRIKITKIETSIQNTTKWERVRDKAEDDPTKQGRTHEYVKTEQYVTTEEEIFDQTAEDVDVKKVICAINGLLLKEV